MRLSLRLKIVGGFAAVAVAALALTGVALVELSQTTSAADASARDSLNQVLQVANLEAGNLRVEAQATGALTGGRPDVIADAVPRITASGKETIAQLDAVGRLNLSTAARQSHDRLRTLMSYNAKALNGLLGTDVPVPDPTVQLPAGFDAMRQLSADPTGVPPEVRQAGTAAADDLRAKSTEQGQVLSQLRSQIEQDAATARKETRSAAGRVLNLLIAFVAIVGVAVIALGIWLSGRLVRRLNATVAVLDAVADGDLRQRADDSGGDEIGRMALAVNRAADGIRQIVAALGDGARTLGTSTESLTGLSSRISASARTAAERANAVSDDAGAVSRYVQTVAAGSGEMDASIRDIAQSANDAARVASDAVGVAESTNRAVSKLGDSSAEIGNVVKVITSIAEQTNLLALNATIEAARAGEAGKGFAVVASEVKDLAQETARATEDIAQRVGAIQSDTATAVEAIGEIGRVISRINEYQLTIASAVEEQTSTTNEMSRSVNDAANGAASIASNIAGVADAADTTTATLAESDRTVNELAGLAREFQAAVGRFRI